MTPENTDTPLKADCPSAPCSPSSFSPLGVDLFGDPIQQETKSPVAQKFLVPPFTILSARDGDWQERKRAWAGMGIKGEVGRDAAVIHCPNQASKNSLEDADYTSIFDPVMCEIAYRWFTAEGMQVVDPFAGGSVRGVVAASMGRKYWGGELRAEQVEANREQAEKLCPANPPQYVCGDSMETMDHAPDADFIFSCPPYGDLEKYSDDPKDLSSMEWHTFVAAYKRIILRACKRLKEDRFACFVVGDFRCPKGFYRNFVSETINGFEACGVRLYNEAILVTSVGSASMRVTKQFEASRKFAKTHQNVLVFCKGDPRRATRAISLENKLL
jgi:DNA modification methylase